MFLISISSNESDYCANNDSPYILYQCFEVHTNVITRLYKELFSNSYRIVRCNTGMKSSNIVVNYL